MDNNILNKRTKGEWNVMGENDIISDNGKYIGLISSGGNFANTGEKEENISNAHFICKAVNNYDSLLEALKRIVDDCTSTGSNSVEVGKDYIKLAKEAIKKCEQ